jgi:hypothetical protein
MLSSSCVGCTAEEVSTECTETTHATWRATLCAITGSIAECITGSHQQHPAVHGIGNVIAVKSTCIHRRVIGTLSSRIIAAHTRAVIVCTRISAHCVIRVSINV